LPAEPIWLTESQVILINQRLVGKTGEPHFLRDANLLSSGLARAANRWAFGDQNIANLAGYVLLGIGRNHPFEQGNKRTAMVSATVFLMLNGYMFAAPSGLLLGQFVERSILGQIPEEAFLRAMRRSTVTTEAWEAFHRGEQ
jgi:death-on-curing protein